MTQTIGLIGAGRMGRGLAGSLLRAGYPLWIHRRRQPSEDPVGRELGSLGARLTSRMADLFTNAEVLLTCLPSSTEVEEVLVGAQGLLSCPDSTVRTVLDFTTARPESTRGLGERLAGRGIVLLDTPMAGGPQQAAEATLNLAVGGEEERFRQMRPVLQAVAKNIFYAGPSGSGNVLKLLNNFLGLLNRATTSAVSLVAERSGIDPATLLDFVRVSGGNSRAFEAQMALILTGNFPSRFALKLGLKDLRYNRELFDAQGLPFPILKDLEAVYSGAAEAGLSDEDVGAVYRFLDRSNPLDGGALAARA